MRLELVHRNVLIPAAIACCATRHQPYRGARQGHWTLDQVKDNGEVTKVGGNSVRIFEEQPDGKWLAKVHIYNLY
jgi:hypothetical protein